DERPAPGVLLEARRSPGGRSTPQTVIAEMALCVDFPTRSNCEGVGGVDTQRSDDRLDAGASPARAPRGVSRLDGLARGSRGGGGRAGVPAAGPLGQRRVA